MRLYFLVSMIFFFPSFCEAQKSAEWIFENVLKTGDYTITSPHVIEGQKAGYAFGGSASSKSRVVKSNIVGFEYPKISGGCGGIDIYAGGINFVSKEEFIDAMRAVAQNSAGYAFQLGMEAVSPMIAGVMSENYNRALQISQMEINSCELASLMVDGLQRRLTTSNKQCTSRLAASGEEDTMTTSRPSCDHSNTNNTDNFPVTNIAWESLMKQDFFKSDKDLAEQIMTMTGTFVSGSKQDKQGDLVFVPEWFPAKLDSGFLDYLLYGGEFEVYECEDRNKCLKIRKAKKKINLSSSWVAKVNEIIKGIQEKILKDLPLTNFEVDFISQSELPVYRVITILSVYQGSDSPVDAWGLAEIIATDTLINVIQQHIDLMKESLKKQSYVQDYSDEVEKFISHVNNIKMRLRILEDRNNEKLYRKLEIIEKIDLIEDKLMSEIRF